MGRKYAMILIGAILLVSDLVLAKVYYSKQEAMVLAFGPGAEVEMLPLFLAEGQRQAIERLGRVKLDSNLYTFYVGKRDGVVIGYAAIETHTVRTKPETLMIVLDPQGNVQRVTVLAFHEPPEYQPPEPWFQSVLPVPLDRLRVGGEIDGVSGATLSVRAAVESVRKVIAIYRVALAGSAGTIARRGE